MKSKNKILTGIPSVDEILASGISKDKIYIIGTQIGLGKSNFYDSVKAKAITEHGQKFIREMIYKMKE